MIRNLLLIVLVGVGCVGCIEYECVNGQRFERERAGDGLWKKSTGVVACYCTGTNVKPIPCAEGK